MTFWGELRKRNVIRVGIAYLVVAWLVLQVIDVVNDPLRLPPWFPTAVMLLLATGLPIALILSWVFELTPGGLKKSHEVSESESMRQTTGRRIDRVIIAVLALAVIVLVSDKYVLDDRSHGSEPVESAATLDSGADKEAELQPGVLPNSVAVLPLVDLSPNPENAFYAQGIHAEIIAQLQKIRSLSVISRDSVMRFAEGRPALADIAATLRVESLLTGDLQYVDGQIRLRVNLVEPQSGTIVWGQEYQRDLSDFFEVQADIGMNVANAMAVEFSLEEQRNIGKRPTDDTEAYELYLAARATDVFPNQFQLIDAALQRDPEFALAWAFRSSLLGLQLALTSADTIDDVRRDRLDAAVTAALLDPSAVEVQAELAAVRATEGEWIEAERGYRRAFGPEFLRGEWEAGLFSLAVGNFNRAMTMAEYVRERDPLNGNAHMLPILGLGLAGDFNEARNAYERSALLFGEQWTGSYWFAMVGLGANPSTSIDDIPFRQQRSEAVSTEVMPFLESHEEGLERLSEVFATSGYSSGIDLMQFAVWAAYFGDAELAFEFAEMAVRGSALNMFTFWFPSMREVRQLPRFKTFIREIGLVDYWNEFGWQEICRPISDDAFECS